MTRFVYIDEAGIGRPDREPFLVVTGVIVHADNMLNAVERRISALADDVIPDEHRPGFVFHATELFNGGGKVFKRGDPNWPRERRYEVADRLANIIKKLSLPIACGIVRRAQFPKTFDGSNMTAHEKTVGAHVTAYMTCAMEVEMWMRKKTTNEVALLVVENNENAKRLIRETQNAHRNHTIERTFDGASRKYFPFRKIKTSPLFEYKEDSITLQIADFCAYVFKKRAMQVHLYDRFYSVLEPLLVAHELGRY